MFTHALPGSRMLQVGYSYLGSQGFSLILFFNPNTHSFPSSHPHLLSETRVESCLPLLSPMPDTQWKSTNICWINKNIAWEGEEMMRQNCEEFKAQRKCGTYIHSGILPSHKKEWNNAICSNVDGPREYHINEASQRKLNIISITCGI